MQDFTQAIGELVKPRIDAEDALRRSGQATPEAYAEIRRRFSNPVEALAAAMQGGR